MAIKQLVIQMSVTISVVLESSVMSHTFLVSLIHLNSLNGDNPKNFCPGQQQSSDGQILANPLTFISGGVGGYIVIESLENSTWYGRLDVTEYEYERFSTVSIDNNIYLFGRVNDRVRT